MATFTSIIKDIKNLSNFSEKNSFLTVILNSFQNKKVKLSEEDRRELAQFAFSEVKKLLSLIPNVTTYKEKDAIFAYEDSLLGIVMLTHSSPAQIPQNNMSDIQALVDLVNRERFVETALDEIFNGNSKEKSDVERLIGLAMPLKDEYQKGQIFHGLLHYQNNIKELPDESRQVFAEYISSEMKRYLAGPLTDDIINNLEIVCDVAQHFINETISGLLYDVLKLNKNNISYYAVSTLLSFEKTIPEEVVISLANDIVYADMTYSLLKRYGLSSMFPSELENPEYLAKSDLVHWLTYPTELGKQPDEIEFLGKLKKKEEYYVFRYRSDSDNLGEDLKGKWLIGWSNDEGGTFSNFDLYSEFEKKTIEKTLKNIKKRLL